MLGARLGNWIINKELGRGGMGNVYLAHEEPGDRVAALKVLAAELARDPGFLHRFQREIEVLRQLDHPNIVRFYEAGSQDGHCFFAMEYVEGRNYAQLLEEEGNLPWSDVLDLALQVCPALKHAHDRGVIHRDIKPSNLLRAESGAIKLTDFGIAHVFAGEHLTATGGVVGTGEYLSPEQAAGKPVSKRSDLYSLGVVLYTLVTGRTLFQGENFVDLLHQHRYGQFDRPGRLVPDLPHDLDAVICQMLEKDPAKRPPDAGVLHRQLESLRRKLERKGQLTQTAAAADRTLADRPRPRAESKEGPATFAGRVVRQELEEEKYGGPVRRFFNRPLVLVALLAVCVGLIAWGLWPPSAESLFQKGEALMQSEDPADWDTAWERYLQPLMEKYPDNPHREQVEEYRRQIEEQAARRKAAREARNAAPATEAQWFYYKGLRLKRQGDEPGARKVWQALVDGFKDVEAEQPWVDLARNELAGGGRIIKVGEGRWEPVRAALERARQLRADGKRHEAERIWSGLEELYRDDPSAAAMREELRRDRGQ